MSKYVNLGEFLRGQKTSAVRMSFAEVERVIGHKLPRSARYPAWWSNNPSNNVMTKVWLEAGFKTEQVDIEGRKLTFRRRSAAPQKQKKSDRSPTRSGYPPFYGLLKGTITIAPGVDLTEPADPDWGKVYDE
jgi:hypothetical protein